jgi:hypothetical protein
MPNAYLRTIRFIAAFCILHVAICSVGCQSSPPAANTPPNVTKPAHVEKLTPEEQAVVDPCAIQLQDISGAMLLYYRDHGDLPEKLEELRSAALPGTELKFTCPASGKPYVYVRTGLQSAGRNKRIVLHDAEGSHDGNYWVVLMAPPKPGQAPFLETVLMPPNLFRTYLLISEQR